MKNLSKSRIIRGSEADNIGKLELRDISDPNQPAQSHKPRPKVGMTAADLEQLQEQARQEAYEAGRKEGFEYGHNEALEQFRQQYNEKLTQLDQILHAFQKPFENLDDQVESEIVQLVISMVRQLVRREVKMDPNQVVGVVREAMSALPVSAQEITLVLNPEDAELIREAFSLTEREQAWKVIEDPVLNRGGCRIQAGDSQIDATLESRLDALIAPLLSEERAMADDTDESATQKQADGEQP